MRSASAAGQPGRYVTWTNVTPSNGAVTMVQWDGQTQFFIGYQRFKFLNMMRISGMEPDGTALPAISPTNSPMDGGIQVTINGVNLCDEALGVDDILWVELCGVRATNIVSASSTQIVVWAGAAVEPGPGSVWVMSESRGLAEQADAFNYEARSVTFELFGIDGKKIAGGTPAVPGAGTDFGEVSDGRSVTNTFTLKNSGDDPLNITSWTTSGAGAARFTLVDLPSVVEPDGSSNIVVVFTPNDEAVFEASVEAVNDSPDNNPFTLNLKGTGIAAGDGEMSVLGTNGVEVASGEAASVEKGTDFGAIHWQSVVTNTFSISNTGGAELTLSSWTTNGPGAGAFEVRDMPGSVAASGEEEFSVVFSPTGAGGHPAWLSIANSDDSPYIVKLAGEGLSASLSATPEGNFGPVLTGRTSNRVFSIENNGDVAWMISGVTTNGDDAAMFEVADVPERIEAGTASNIVVSFTPASGGAKSAALVFEGDAAAGDFTLNVSGSGLNEPRFVLLGTDGLAIESDAPVSTASGTDAGLQYVGGPVTRTFTITNSGSVALVVTGSELTGDGEAAFEMEALNFELAAGATRTFDVTVAPQTIGVHTATVAVTYNVLGGVYLLNLEVEGTDPRISVSATNNGHFGYVRAGTEVSSTFVITNAGTETLSVSGYEISNMGYQIDDMPGTVAAGTASNFVVRFAPLEPGDYPALLRITNNAMSGVYTTQLTGAAFVVSPDRGPLAGGNSVTVSNGNFGTISGVRVGGIAATLGDHGEDWFTITAMPPFGSPGARDITVQTDGGNRRLPNAYTYNPAGEIGGEAWDWSAWEEVPGLPDPWLYPAAATYSNTLYVVSTNRMLSFDGTNWNEEASLPVNVSRCGIAVYDGGLYTVGGRTAITNVFRFDGVDWSETAGLPAARQDVLAASIGNYLYSIGGNNPGGGGSQTNVYRFDGATWSEVPGVPSVMVELWGASPQESTDFLSGGMVDDFFYIAGGVLPRTNAYAYNGMDFEPVAGLPAPRAFTAAASLNNALHVFGGISEEMMFVAQNTHYRFDGTSWAEAPAMNMAVYSHAGTMFREQIYAIGGNTGNGNTWVTNVWRYPARIEIEPVVPSEGSWTGGYEVVISGTNLGDGGDITNVTLAGVSVESIVSQSATQILVLAGANASGGVLGDVVVHSTSVGETVKADAFTYLAAEMSIFGPTNFGYALAGTVVTNWLSITNAGTETLRVSGYEISDVRFEMADWPETVEVGGVSNFAVKFLPEGAGDYSAEVVFTNNTVAGEYSLSVTGSSFVISTNRGPLAGGNNVTVSNGIFGEVQGVMVDGVDVVELVDHGANWFTITLPRANSAGLKDITVQTDGGDRLLFGAYAYNEQGVITNVVPSSGSWTGGVEVLVQGTNLADADENVVVTLCGIEAMVESASATEIQAVAGAAPGALTGAVRVVSTSYGETVLHGGFTYTASWLVMLGTNGVDVASGEVASAEKGTKFPHVLPGTVVTNWLSITNAGTETLRVSGYEISDERFEMADWPESVEVGGVSNFAVKFMPDGAGDFAAAVTITNNSPDELFTLNLAGACYVISTNRGPLAGGNSVTVSNGHFGVITKVLVGATQVSPVHEGGDWFTIEMPGAESAGVVDLVVQTQDQGDILLAGAYTYNPAGVITSITPDRGPKQGGFEVTIAGTDLMDEDDLADVTLVGVSVTNIVSATATEIVAWAGAAAEAGVGDVRVISVGFGETVKSNAFTYTEPGMWVLGTNGAEVASGEVASGEKGTLFPHLALGASFTNTFAITNSGSGLLTISGHDLSNEDDFAVDGMPATVEPGEVGYFDVVFGTALAGHKAAVLTISNDAGAGDYVVNLAGGGLTVVPDNGPLVGGTVVTLTAGLIGDGADITSVTVGGVAARLNEQGAEWVTFVVDASETPGLKDVVVTSTSLGATTFADAYTVNPAGEIGFWESEASTNWNWRSVGHRVVPGQITAVGADRPVRALYWDAGRLYAGGEFDNLGRTNISRVGYFEWGEWHGFGDTVVQGNVNAVVPYGDGVLAGGDFDAIGGVQVRGIAHWTGAEWAKLGEGAGLEFVAGAVGRANSIALLSDDSFVVGGYFTNVNGQAMRHIAKWDGSSWTNLGQGFNNEVHAVAVGPDGSIYAGGTFTDGGKYQVARWDGNEWSNLGGGFHAVIHALAVASDGELYAGSHRVVRWDGAAWINVGDDFNSAVNALAVGADDMLYAGGDFTSVGAMTARRVAVWDGDGWGNLTTGLRGVASPVAHALAVNAYDGSLYAGGEFRSAGGSNCWNVAQWFPTLEGWDIGVSPAFGGGAGGYQVTITGTNLMSSTDESDLLGVTICGSSVTGVVSATATQIVVWAGPAVRIGIGDVEVHSVRFGETVARDAFTYNAPLLKVLGTNEEEVASGEVASVEKGTKFPHLVLGASWTNTFGIANEGGETLALTGFEISDMRYDISDWPEEVEAGTVSNFVVTFTPDGAGDFAVAVTITNNSPGDGVFTLNLAGSCFVISTNRGPLAGGNSVTVSNGHFGVITKVLVGAAGATQVSPVLEGGDWFTIEMPGAESAGVVDLVVQTQDQGDILLAGAYTYNPAGVITSVVPASGSWAGGETVTILGTDLTDPTDLTDVFLAGVAATIDSASATQIVVTAGAAAAPGVGDVRVVSVSHGETKKSDAFTYTGAGMVVSGLNDVEIPSGSAASFGAGTYFGHRLPDQPVTNLFTIRNDGDEALALTGFAISDMRYEISEMPESVEAGETETFSVVFSAGEVGSYSASLTISNNSPSEAYVLNLAGGIYGLSHGDGPYAGGNTITISSGVLGDGSDIQSVRFSFRAAEILEQGTDWVTVRVPGQELVGAVDIQIQSDSAGVALLPGAYSYNEPGRIFGAKDWTSWEEVVGLPLPLESLAVGALNGSLYAVGGSLNGTVMDTVYRFTGHSWVDAGSLEEARSGISAAVFEEEEAGMSELHVPGGFGMEGQVMASGYVLDGSDLDERDEVPERAAYAIGSHGENLILAGGQSMQDGNSLGNVYHYDGEGWSSIKAKLPGARHGLAAGQQGESLFFLGGYLRMGGNISVNDDVYRFDGSSFKAAVSLPAPRAGLAAATLDDQLYAMGGFENNRPWANVWRFDGADWSEAPGLPAARHALAAATADGVIYAVGGNDGTASVTNVFRYPATETGVLPVSGSVLGGFEVVINGVNLSDGTLADVTNVTLRGAAATVTAVHGSTQVVVQAGSGEVGLGDVRVYSERFGETVRGNAFTYIAMPEIVVLGTNGEEVASEEVASVEKGTDFGTLFADESGTHVLSITNSGDIPLSMEWTTNGAGASAFMIEGTNVVAHRSAAPLTIRYAPTAVGTHTAAVVIANNSTNSPFVLNLAGTMVDPQMALVGIDGVSYPDNAPARTSAGTDFGMVATGEHAQVSLAVTNYGQTALSITGYSLSGTGADAFSVSNLPVTVEAGASESFELHYQPLELGSHSLTLALTNNTTGAVFRVRAAGLGARAGEIGLTRSRLTFSGVYDGTAPQPEVYAITNRGDLAFSYTNELSYGAGAAGWLTLSQLSGTLSSGTMHRTTGTVSIASLNAGTYYATNTIRSEMAANSPVEFQIELVVERAAQTIDFTNPGAQVATNVTGLSAAAGSGLPVVFEVVSGEATLTGLTQLTYSASGMVAVRATQAGNSNWLAARSVTQSFEVAKALADVVFTNLAQTYSGAARAAGTETTPEGLAVNVLYDGEVFVPVNAGSYAVAATLDEDMWQGSATGLLVVAKASQVITNFTPTNGSAFVVTNAVTLDAQASSGLQPTYSVVDGPGELDMNTLTFTGAGTVLVVAAQSGNMNWDAADAVTNLYTVGKAETEMFLEGLEHKYDGDGKEVSVRRFPMELEIVTTYDGSTDLPVNVGSYAVTSVVHDVMYAGMATGTMQIAQAEQTIDFAPVGEQVSTNVTPLFATASSGLPVTFDVVSGEADLEDGTNLTYRTDGTVVVSASQAGDDNWLPAAVTQSFAVVKVSQAPLTFAPTTPQVFGTTHPLVAGGGSGTGVFSFVISSGGHRGQIVGGTNLVATSGSGDLVVMAIKAADDWYAQASMLATVVCARAEQTIEFAGIGDQHLTNQFGLAATATSGLDVGFEVVGGRAELSGGTNLTFYGTGTVHVAAVQAGDSNYEPAPSVTNAFNVYAGELMLLSSNGLLIATNAPAAWELGTDLGVVPTNETRTVSILLTNASASRLTRITEVSTNGSAFFSISNVPPELVAGAVATATVHYAPGAVGLHEAAFEISNDTVNHPYVLNVAGAGAIPGELALRSSRVTWTTTYGDTNPVIRVFEVGNTGDVAIACTMDVRYGGDAADWVTLNATNAMLPGADWLSFTGTVSATGFNAGTYTATNIIGAPLAINDPQQMLFQMVVNKATQAIDFAHLPDQEATNRFGLAATASSGLPVSFAVVSGPADLTDGTNLTYRGEGRVAIRAMQAGNTNWHAAASITQSFDVVRGIADIMISNTNQVYDGVIKPVTVTTDPAGLDVLVTYNSLYEEPINAGDYTVVATIEDDYYQGVKTGALHIAQAAQTIDFPNPGEQVSTNVTPLFATASSGLPVAFEVVSGEADLENGANLTYRGAGIVEVRASQAGNSNWLAAASVTQAFEVVKAVASVLLYELEHTYDGTGKAAVALTQPGGLEVELTYDGSTNVPVNAGSYAAAGTVDDVMYQGVGTGTLVIAKADQTITDFPNPGDQFWTNVVTLTATASSELEVAFEVVEGPAELTGLTELTFDGYGEVVVRASQAGDDNWNAAPLVDRAFEALGPQFVLLGTNGQEVASGEEASSEKGTDFGEAIIGLQVLTNWFTITNSGNAAMAIISVETNGNQATSFSLSLTSSVMAAASTVEIPVVFDPLAFGSNTAHFSFTYDGINSPYVLHVAGEGRGVALTVATEYGVASPPTGVYEMAVGGVFTNWMQTPDERGTTQYVSTGWVATGGLDPTSGEGTQAVVTVTGEGTLTWLWSTNYWLETDAGPHGDVDVGDGWQPAGVTTQITATADPYYAFSEWTGDVPGGEEHENPLDLLMDGSKFVMAHFEAVVTTNRPTPHWWLALHGFAEEDFEAVVDLDWDGDGIPTGDEWIMDTDPTDSNSFLRVEGMEALYGPPCWEVVWTNYEPYEVITQEVCTVVGHVVTWPCSTNRVYDVEYNEDFPLDIWVPLEGMTNLVPTSDYLRITNRWDEVEGPGDWRIYRLRVRIPE